MKKLITTILAAVLAISAFAKTQSELVAEYNALANVMQVQRDWATANKTDLLAIWANWKTSAFAKFDDSGLTKEQKSENGTLTRIFGKLCDRHYEEMLPMSDIAFIRIGCGQIVPRKGADWYAQLKAADFVVDGVALADGTKFTLAAWFGDTETAMSMPASVGVRSSLYPSIVAKSLLSSANLTVAKEKINEIKQAYILAGLDIPPTIQAVSKELTSRLLDSKISK